MDEFKSILTAFKRFIKNGFHRKYFTKRIYEYLKLKCDFIAHFDINNFYKIYFTNIEGFNRFIEKMNNFDNEIVNELNRFIQKE